VKENKEIMRSRVVLQTKSETDTGSGMELFGAKIFYFYKSSFLYFYKILVDQMFPYHQQKKKKTCMTIKKPSFFYPSQTWTMNNEQFSSRLGPSEIE
jgi:hypothetical protein